MDYIAVVPIKFSPSEKPYLFMTKAFTGLKKGDFVKVENERDKFGEVIADAINVTPDDATYEFLLAITGATHPLKKIIGRVIEIKYEGE